MKILHMVLDGHEVGQLIQDRHGATRVLTPPIDGAPRISIAFTPSDTPVKPALTRAYLAGLLPDNADVREAIAGRLGVSSESQFALIAKIGADCPGAIQFLDEAQLAGERSGRLVPISDAGIAARLKRLRAGQRDWGVPGEHWSLGGAQSKIALRREGGQWHQAEGLQATSHIIKPGIARFRSQALVEHVSLRALGHLGLSVAGSEFVYFDDEPAVVVERFDRIADDDGSLRRVHQEDLCQSTSTLPTNKYTVKAEDVVRVLRGGGATEGGVLEFVRACIANWVLAAPDAHAKNYSVFLGPAGVEALAPLYDDSTGLGYRDSSQLAMGFGGEKDIHKVTGRHLLAFARAVGVDGGDVLASAHEMASLMPMAFAVAMDGTPIDRSDDQAWLSETLERLATHCAHVLTMLERTR